MVSSLVVLADVGVGAVEEVSTSTGISSLRPGEITLAHAGVGTCPLNEVEQLVAPGDAAKGDLGHRRLSSVSDTSNEQPDDGGENPQFLGPILTEDPAPLTGGRDPIKILRIRGVHGRDGLAAVFAERDDVATRVGGDVGQFGRGRTDVPPQIGERLARVRVCSRS